MASDVAINGTPSVGSTLNGTYTYTDADGDFEGASTFAWTVGNVVQPETGQTYVVKAGDVGKSITFTVTPVAVAGTSPGLPVTSSSVTGNSAPVASNVAINGTPSVGSTLNGTYTYTDADGDSEGASTFAWMVGNVVQPETGQTYVVKAGDVGKSITFTVTPVAVAGTSPGLPVTSSSVTGNSAPVASNVAINGTPSVGSTLNGTYTYTDADGDSEGASTFAWMVGNVVQPETGQTYVVKAGDVGKSVTFAVTPVAQTGTSPGATASASIDVFASAASCNPSAPPVKVGDVSITNADAGSQGCTPDVFTATFDGTHFSIDKPGPASLVVKVDAWDPELSDYPIPATIVDPAPPSDSVWCSGTPQSYSMPSGGQVWCLVDQGAVLAGQDDANGSITGHPFAQLMQVSETWLLDGDAGLCRKCT